MCVVGVGIEYHVSRDPASSVRSDRLKMPTTALGLLLFIALLTPGFAYTLRREREAPERRLSVFRETVSIAFASILATAFVLGVFAGVRTAAPTVTPDVGTLIAAPRPYAVEHYRELFAWGFGLLAAATVIAWTAGGQGALLLVRRLPGSNWLFGVQPHEPFLSAWGRAFLERPESRVYVGATQIDGSYVAGYLRSYSRASDDLPDRDLVLTGDITYRAAGDDEAVVLPNVGAVVLSARNMLVLTVSYVEVAASASDHPSGRDADDSDDGELDLATFVAVFAAARGGDGKPQVDALRSLIDLWYVTRTMAPTGLTSWPQAFIARSAWPEWPNARLRLRSVSARTSAEPRPSRRRSRPVQQWSDAGAAVRTVLIPRPRTSALRSAGREVST